MDQWFNLHNLKSKHIIKGQIHLIINLSCRYKPNKDIKQETNKDFYNNFKTHDETHHLFYKQLLQLLFQFENPDPSIEIKSLSSSSILLLNEYSQSNKNI